LERVGKNFQRFLTLPEGFGGSFEGFRRSFERSRGWLGELPGAPGELPAGFREVFGVCRGPRERQHSRTDITLDITEKVTEFCHADDLTLER
jgi:hypothetical protein